MRSWSCFVLARILLSRCGKSIREGNYDMDNDTNRNYDEIAEKLAIGQIDLDGAAIPLLLEEARKRRDGDMIAHVASWYEDVKDDKARYLELAKEAAELGSPEANFWLGHEYLSGENLPRDYEKAYSYFTKGQDVDWVPINPENNREIMEDDGGEVTSESLLAEPFTNIEWWLFLLENHPNRSIKCGVADWYMKQGGEENRVKALKLFEESANEGFEFSFFKLIEFYSEGEFKDVAKGRYWFEKAVEHGFDEACFATELGVESLRFRKLKVAADAGDYVAAAKVAVAYLHGIYDGDDKEYVCCNKDLDKARHYGVLACFGDDGGQMLVNALDDCNVEDERFLYEVVQEAGLE